MHVPLRSLLALGLLSVLAGCGADAADEVDPAPVSGSGSGSAGSPVEVVPVADVTTDTDTDAPTSDPEAWVALEEFQGVAVETLREFHANGRIKRIRTIDPTREGPDGFQGPELAFFPNGVMHSRQTWIAGQLEGDVVYWYNTGSLRWRCLLRGGERDGLYEEFHRNGDPKARFEYQDKIAHGEFREWFVDNEPHTESHWIEGVQVGVHRQWARGDKLALEEHFLNGERHGSYLKNAPDGSGAELQGAFVEGQRDGVWSRYEEGSLIATETWRRGVQHGTMIEYLAGAKAAETTFAEGLESGVRTLFFSDGSKRAEGPMVAGERSGRWTYWKKDGSVNAAWSGEYANDEKVGD